MSSQAANSSTELDPLHVACVVPCFNEAQMILTTLGPLIEEGYTVILVNDGSRDGLEALVDSLPIINVRHFTNLGQGAALQTGSEVAARLPWVRYVVHFDADGQHDYREIPRLVEPLVGGRADVVLGSRFIGKGRTLVPRRKQVLLQGARFVNWMFTGLFLTDAHNGFRAMTVKATNSIKLSQPGFAHASEILWLIRLAKLRFVEVPTVIRYTRYSVAKGQRIVNAFNILWDLFLLRFLR